jgi:hypothetical protein
MANESVKDFKTPYERWSSEIKTAEKSLDKWKKQSDKIVQRYLGDATPEKRRVADSFNLNLFHSNVTTLTSMLYGNTPKIDVSRRYAQADDDVGRVAAEMMERLLNLDMAENGAETDAIFRATLQDRLLSGLGCARVRYTAEFSGEEGAEQLTFEDAPLEYYYWGDVLFPWARKFTDLPWMAYRSYLTKDEVAERFGEEVADNLQYKEQKASNEGVDVDEHRSNWEKRRSGSCGTKRIGKCIG